MFARDNNKILRVTTVTLLFFLCIFAISIPKAKAQSGSMALTITPPIFQMTVTPGVSWQSTIKVTNNNDYDITVYASILNFEADGESGASKFTPILSENSETKGRLLSDWIVVSEQPFPIKAGKSIQVPFAIVTPEDAEPGGQYAAIMVGTQPIEGSSSGSSLKISSFISSLIFAKVEGEVVEKGRIREFSTEKSFYQTPEANFELRFENKGNVHMIPQGNIIIYNMWNKERGRIEVNKKVGYGTVLPDQIRTYKYAWQGEDNIFEIGRYRAVATIVYGDEERQSEFYETNFWVIPMKPVLSVLGFLVIFIGFIYWSIRKYIRKAIELEKQYTQMDETEIKSEPINQLPSQSMLNRVSTPKRIVKQVVERPRAVQRYKKPELKTLARPLINGAIDLRSVGSASAETRDGVSGQSDESITLVDFMKKYKLFFVFIIISMFGGLIILQYFGEVLEKERDFEVNEIIEGDDF